ncbi:MAG: hypothetical protein V7642_684 [Burkholderiales bacterium]|jgi:hypothetical protein
MAIHIVQFEKHSFVCGLFWQALSRPRELVKEAKDLARKIESDMMVLRVDHTAAQAGFAQSRDGARKGLYSLAAVVSKTLAVEGAYYDGERQPVHNWLGAFKLDDGKWAYFAVRDASFLPNGDFAGTKEEVVERLNGDYGLGGWNAVIGDEELADCGFHNFNARRIETLLPRKSDGSIKTHKWWGLRPVDNKPSWRTAAAGATVAVAAIAGLAYWQHYQRKQEDLKREQALEAARRELQGQATLSVLPSPWVALPPPQEFARACVERLRYLSPGGWQLDSYECTASQAIHTWSRKDSPVEFLLEQVAQAQVDAGGDKATYAQPMSGMQGRDEALLELSQVLPPLLSTLQLMQVPVRVAPLPPPAPPANGAGMAAPYWRGLGISLKTRGISPDEIATALNRPGVRIAKLVYQGGEWSIEGVLYAK